VVSVCDRVNEHLAARGGSRVAKGDTMARGKPVRYEGVLVAEILLKK
jgi:hypothetical protein